CYRLQAPAFIGIVIFVGAANSKGWHFVEEEIETVIVIHHDNNVGICFFQPFLCRHIAIKEALPVRLLLQVVGNGITHSRDVRTCQSTDNLSHSSNLLRTSRVFPSGSHLFSAGYPGIPWW